MMVDCESVLNAQILEELFAFGGVEACIFVKVIA